MQTQLAGQGLDFQRIEAIDGGVGPHDVRGACLTRAEVACHRSHRHAWQLLLRSGAPHALVLEDDVVLSPRTAGVLAQPDLLPKGADVLRLETRGDEIRVLGRSRRVGGVHVHRMITIHLGAAAYILSRGCAERLLAEDHSETVPVDNVLFDPSGPSFGHLQIYQLDPGLCIQGDVLFGAHAPANMTSDIEPARRQRFDALDALYPPSPRRRVSLGEKVVWRIKKVGRPAYLYLARGVRQRRIEFDGPAATERV
jgi:glycosyl transferase family 25